jgi:hypothetical protein
VSWRLEDRVAASRSGDARHGEIRASGVVGYRGAATDASGSPGAARGTVSSQPIRLIRWD